MVINPPIQPLMLSAKQGGIGSHFYSLWYDPVGELNPQPSRHSNHKATELVVFDHLYYGLSLTDGFKHNRLLNLSQTVVLALLMISTLSGH